MWIGIRNARKHSKKSKEHYKLANGKELILYVASFGSTVSIVLTNKPETTVEDQKPIFYHSKILRGVEQRYSQIEKWALVVILGDQKLRPYFDLIQLQFPQITHCFKLYINWTY